MIYLSRAIRRRICHECHNLIEPDEWHLRYQSNDTVTPRNLCSYCAIKLGHEAEERNRR